MSGVIPIDLALIPNKIIIWLNVSIFPSTTAISSSKHVYLFPFPTKIVMIDGKQDINKTVFIYRYI